jgi:hypothetical protein
MLKLRQEADKKLQELYEQDKKEMEELRKRKQEYEAKQVQLAEAVIRNKKPNAEVATAAKEKEVENQQPKKISLAKPNAEVSTVAEEKEVKKQRPKKISQAKPNAKVSTAAKEKVVKKPQQQIISQAKPNAGVSTAAKEKEVEKLQPQIISQAKPNAEVATAAKEKEVEKPRPKIITQARLNAALGDLASSWISESAEKEQQSSARELIPPIPLLASEKKKDAKEEKDYSLPENWTVEKFVRHVKGSKKDGDFKLVTRWISFTPNDDTLEPLTGSVVENNIHLLRTYAHENAEIFDAATACGLLLSV